MSLTLLAPPSEPVSASPSLTREQKRHIRETFAIIEPWLERHLRGIIALERIGDVRYVAHYLDYNVPIEIDIPESTVCVDARNDSFIAAFQAADPGLAYFGRVPRRSSEPARVDA